MIDIKLIRENPDLVKENIKKKFQDEKIALVDEVKGLDDQVRAAKQEGDSLRSKRNSVSKEIGGLMGRMKKAESSGDTAEAEKPATADERAKTEEKTTTEERTTSEEITTRPLYVATETQPEVRMVQMTMPEMNRAKWQERYGVRQKSYKRKQIQRGKWNRR